MSPPRGDAAARRAEILDAALRVFGQYGYRRTSVDDIAREAGIAKGTIYLSFAGKDEIFRDLSLALTDRMLTGAQAARYGPGDTADRLAAMADAWYGTYMATVQSSPHAAELMDAKYRLSADLVGKAAGSYQDLVRDVMADAVDAGELDLAGAGLTADSAAMLLNAAARGLEFSPDAIAEHRRYLGTLVRVVVAGLRAGPPAGDG
jgi:AcrR family transcriptional regulator